MKSLTDFIIEPKGDRYNNSKKVNGKELIVNTEVYNHKFVNQKAIVKAIPILGETSLNVGDEIIVHHNIFRRWHDIQGIERNSRSYFKDNLYFVKLDQIHLHKRHNKWNPINGYSFIKPIKSLDDINNDKEQELIGIVKYADKELSSSGVKIGDLVGYRPRTFSESIVDGERLYKIMSKFITIKYEYQGNEEEYNPSWAESS